jgi:hypothetical protein
MVTMIRRRAPLLTLALAVLAAGCQTPTSRIARIYADLEQEVADSDPVALPSDRAAQEHNERADSVREIVEKHGVSTKEDTFQASVILVGTSRIPDMDLAETLARQSAQLGEPRGLRVAAEAIDKRAMLQGRPQKYGTQFIFEYVLDKWSLYPIDPMSTDEDRAAMGVPTYAQLLEKADLMNQARRRREKSH